MNTLDLVFDWLLQASLRASLLTVIVLLLQVLLRKQLSARWLYALWLPVLVVLLMPVLPESRWSAESFFFAPEVSVPLSIPENISFVSAEQATTEPSRLAEKSAQLFTWILLWVMGAGALILSGLISFTMTLRRFRRASCPPDAELLAEVAHLSKELRLSRAPRICLSTAISSPAVAGLFRPTLLLPVNFRDTFTPREVGLVLRHELMHLKRHDLPLNALLCLLLALHWFNPFLWLAFFKVRLDREVACDAQVLQNDTNDRRREYGHALLKVETAFCPRGLSLGFVGIFQRGSALRSRIQSIANHHQPHPIMKSSITLCMVLLTFFGITRAQQPTNEKPLEAAAPKSPIQAKLDSLIFPKVQFSGATLEEALAFLRAKSRILDTSEPNEAKRGVNFLWQGGSAHEALISMDLKNVPLSEVVKYTADLAGLEYRIEENAVVFLSRSKDTAAKPATPINGKAVESAKKYILPQVQFSKATVEEAVEFLRLKFNGRDDAASADINLLLKSGGNSKALITLNLKDISAWEALRYIAELSNHTLSADDHSIILTPR